MSAVEASVDLPSVRRFEAAGFRAWPAETVAWDGTWSVRTTPGLPTRRSNSVTPLDRGDCELTETRLAALRRIFSDTEFPVTFRITPLTGRRLTEQLDARGWPVVTPSLVMRSELTAISARVDDVDQVSAASFCHAGVAIGAIAETRIAPLEALLGRIPAKVGLFVSAVEGRPVAKAMCTVDGSLAGIYEVATAPAHHGKGFGRRVVAAALDFARANGASTGFLMVDAANEPAIALYKSFGFSVAYPYEYRVEPEATP